MDLPKTFDPRGLDQRWYDRWMEHKLFESTPDDREPYTIVIPPPNVTGVLHMGHALNNTIQDILIRRARMQGKNACWVPGTDHASIATEAKVVQMLREKGIKKSELSREEFLKYAFEWKEKYGGIILQQLKKLGCSCDWSRISFTMDDDYYKAVIKVFVDLHKKGYIYRGLRMINWDPKAKTSLSDEEVIKKEVKSQLYFVRYQLDNSLDSPLTTHSITIATVRPETILGDSAICVNPKDERYKNLVGKFAFVPLINRLIPIIADEYVEMDFGTGALKVTPAHDMNDYQLGLKHHLEVIDTLNEDGTMSEAAQLYVGQDRFECRKNIVKDLEAQGHLVKIEDYTNQIGFSERTDAVVEPRLSLQWWCSMKEMAKPALAAVMKEEIKFYPKKFVNLYEHWMEGIKDWCVSRQLWWGHRIPAWYAPDGRFAVAETIEEALQILNAHDPRLTADDLKQDDDVLDTWFSSWLWPFEVFHGLSHPGNEEVKYYYPTDTLVTAPEIIFFWVARMIMAGFEFMKEKPFSEVYFTGIVRDTQGRKMSKSLGNSPDLLHLIDKYGADAVRFGILISSPAGNDLLFDEKLIEQGSRFNNKIWNALRLVKGWEVEDKSPSAGNQYASRWMDLAINDESYKFKRYFEDFAISGELQYFYKFVWDEFCSWFLEMIKPPIDGTIDVQTYEDTCNFFEKILKLLHPFMPFISEELYQMIRERPNHEFIASTKFPESDDVSGALGLTRFHILKEVVIKVRDLRNRNGTGMKAKLSLFIMNKDLLDEGIKENIRKLANVEIITDEKESENLLSFLVGSEYFFLEIPNQINVAEEKSRLEKDLEYNRGFLESVMKKLSNEKFFANAKPDVLNNEQKKAIDAKEKIRLIEEQLQTYGK